jgi:pimeloyl-ACP methyl ester carboxylesterase
VGYSWGRWFLFLLVLGRLSVTPLVGGENTLEQRWNREISDPQSLSDQRLRGFQAKNMLFFGGILNGLARINSSYFTDSLEALEEMGISSEYFGPWSFKSPNRNVDAFRAQIEERYSALGKPLVLVGHSKGGLELLYTSLRYPDLVLSGKVERVVLIQAPVQGTPLADTDHLSWLARWISIPFREGLKYLGRKIATSVLAKNYKEFHRTLEREYGYLGNAVLLEKEKQVSDAIFYVRSKRLSNSFSPGLSIVLTVAWDSLDSLGSNDGLVLTDDQLDLRFGKDLGVLNADHLTVVISGAFSNGSLLERKAFTRALLYQLYPDH